MQWYTAPGRVALMGHYSGAPTGKVLSIATQRDSSLAAVPGLGNQIRLFSLNDNQGFSLDLGYTPQDSLTGWQSNLKGVIWAMREAGYEIKPLDGVLESTLPFHEKLGTGIALQALLALMIRDQNGSTISDEKLARICAHSHERFGSDRQGLAAYYTVFSSEKGSATQVTLESGQLSYHTYPDEWALVYAHLPSVPESLSLARSRVETLTRRALDRLQLESLAELTPEGFAQGRDELTAESSQVCQEVLAESGRVESMGKAFVEADKAACQALMEASMHGQMSAFGAESPRMEALCQAMRAAPGHIGVRPCQDPYSGCVIALLEKAQLKPFCEWVEKSYQSAIGEAVSLTSLGVGGGARRLH